MPLVKIDTAKLNANKSLHPSFHLRETDAAHLEKLATGQRVVLKLRHTEKMTYEEIARDTGWPINTIKTRIHRGRQKILELRAAVATETMQEPTMPVNV